VACDRKGKPLVIGACGGGCGGGSCTLGCDATEDSVLALSCDATVFALDRTVVKLCPFVMYSDRGSGSSERCECGVSTAIADNDSSLIGRAGRFFSLACAASRLI
jgi:hypothetical protein